MTEKANPSINRAAEAFKTAGAIAYGGNPDGYISPAGSPTEMSVQDLDINENALSAFDENSNASSLNVVISGGEAFVFGSWLAIDTQTTVTLQSNTSNQTVYVGWNKDGADDVIVGLDGAFEDASGNADQKIPLWTFNTNNSGVTGVTDERSFDQIPQDRVEQGSGSGLDADTVDGKEASDIAVDISNDGTTVATDVADINFASNINASDDGDDTATVSLSQGPGSNLDADTVDNIQASELATSVSDDGSQIITRVTDLDFTSHITASDDGDSTTTISIDDDFVLLSGDTMSGNLDMGSNTVANVADPTVAQDAATKNYTDTTFVDVAGDTMSGDLDMGSNFISDVADPTNPQDAVTKTYADTTFVDVSGDTMSGDLQMGANNITNVNNPVNPKDAANKTYVDTTFVDAAGDTMSGDLDMDSNVVTNLPTPSAASDAAPKEYVDSIAQSLDIKESVVAATDGSNIDLTSSSDPGQIDGVTLTDEDRVLLKDQNTPSENGVYVATTASDPTTWSRSADADTDTEVDAGMFLFVEQGTKSSDRGYVLVSDDPLTVGSDALTFTQFSGAGQITAGNAMTKSGDTLDVDESAISHDNLADISTDDHHTKYTDTEAVNAVNAETTLSVNISGDADTVDGNNADDFVAVAGDTMTGDFTIQGALFADQSTGNLDIAGTLTENASL